MHILHSKGNDDSCSNLVFSSVIYLTPLLWWKATVWPFLSQVITDLVWKLERYSFMYSVSWVKQTLWSSSLSRSDHNQYLPLWNLAHVYWFHCGNLLLWLLISVWEALCTGMTCHHHLSFTASSVLWVDLPCAQLKLRCSYRSSVESHGSTIYRFDFIVWCQQCGTKGIYICLCVCMWMYFFNIFSWSGFLIIW